MKLSTVPVEEESYYNLHPQYSAYIPTQEKEKEKEKKKNRKRNDIRIKIIKKYPRATCLVLALRICDCDLQKNSKGM